MYVYDMYKTHNHRNCSVINPTNPLVRALPAGVSAQEGGQSAERGKFEKTEVASEVGRSDPKKIVLPPSDLGDDGTGG